MSEDKTYPRVGDPETLPLRFAAIKTRLAYEEAVLDLAEATNIHPVIIEDGLIKALVSAEASGIDTLNLDFGNLAESLTTPTEAK